jgi:hypothetical protein
MTLKLHPAFGTTPVGRVFDPVAGPETQRLIFAIEYGIAAVFLSLQALGMNCCLNSIVFSPGVAQ